MAFTNTVTLSLVRIWKRQKNYLRINFIDVVKLCEKVRQGRGRGSEGWFQNVWLTPFKGNTSHGGCFHVNDFIEMIINSIKIKIVITMEIKGPPLVVESHRWQSACQSFQICRRRGLWRTPDDRMINSDDDDFFWWRWRRMSWRTPDQIIWDD